MAELPRAECPACHARVALRRNGTFREHPDHRHPMYSVGGAVRDGTVPPCEMSGAEHRQTAAAPPCETPAAGQLQPAGARQCASPLCSRPVVRPLTGRPGRYCSPTCRQAAYRARARAAEMAARDAERLAAARAAMSRLWPQLEIASLGAAETAATVLSYAAVEDEADRGALEWKLGELRQEVDELERLALGYRRAAEQVAELSAERPSAIRL